MLDFLELEETVGRAWHRLIGNTRTWPRFPDEAVRLGEVQAVLAVYFRGLGGERAVQIAPARGRTSAHRLRLRQRMGLGEEKLVQPARDHATLMLPAEVDLFPSRRLNRDLYFWLAAMMAVMPLKPVGAADPLSRDLALLSRAGDTVRSVLASYPAMRQRYRRLCRAVLNVRQRRSLPSVEQHVENRTLSMLRAGAGLNDEMPPVIFPRCAPTGYLPMLPVPLWPDVLLREETERRNGEDEPARGGDRAEGSETTRHVATREAQRQSERSPFILNRFEKILAMAEMVNVDRPADDSDDHDASAADELDDMTLGERKGRPAARFRFDLDLPPEALDRTPLMAELTYPEWDYRGGGYLKDHCRVLAAPASAEGLPVEADPTTKSLIRRVRRQFEVLRPRHEMLRAQIDGADLDLDAVVRARTDLRAGGQGSDRIHMMSRPQAHDLAVTILMDVSLSTDAWFDDLRVLDVEKQALQVLAHGLSACGDAHEILTFTSRRRDWVRIETVKAFDEAMSATIEARIAALKPGYYTRMGAAIRHAAARLVERPNRRKLLIVLTDGKPNDVDHYEGRFALEDSRRAVGEARRSGISVFGVTVDREAKSYVPVIFGQNGYAVVSNIGRLPAALPAIYRGLVS
ncbi:nitric oxide reductase activation protein NorD [Sinorhizobium medicae]|uniref:Protein NorD n=1 Tax=Sinorhizobium medicae TaxID=110321 RepID=A0A508XA28_9HYPH|nr:nitric oxide reductase activation protein NorD [Sinorhizobium medicae]MBO1960294.1 nitric oxide reductase activation protein NorD [Sinorhizobium medicae]MDX0694289.1 VWA domain-containing protein [Sinorhizobium medicae]MDX0743472.1 VWA domain-containing protein [Sinorhizobium medicae]MDX0769896.1 VWA domain-containing protein [Sinorhizobium medicae]MDX0903852.1 VWA domain-containing protein [Sinorhizobium medicae]